MQTFTALGDTSGKLEFVDEDRLRQFVRMNAGELFVNIGKNRRKKGISSPQRAYYFGVILQLISDHTGESVDDLHDHFKVRFLMHGERFERPKSISSLTSAETEEYFHKIRMFAQLDLNVFIPLPNEAPLTAE